MGMTLPPKKYLFGNEAREKMFKGIDLMRKCVTATLGPNGRNAVIDRYMVNDITKDGVTVLGDVVAEDSFEEMGCKQVRDASTKTNDEAGDGTTTAIEIAWAACRAGMKRLEEGTNVIRLQDGMQKAIEAVDAHLLSIAIPCVGDIDRYEQVATIASQDKGVGKKVADIFMESGEHGVVEIERMDKPGIETEHTDGMQIDNGWMNPYFITDFNNLSFVIDDCHVLVTDREITAFEELKWMERMGMEGKKKVVIFCDDCSGDALATLVKSARAGSFRCCVVKAPAFGARKLEILKDIATVTGATLISEETGYNLPQVRPEHIGKVRQITVRQKKTVIIADREFECLVQGEKTTVDVRMKERVEQIQAQITDADEGFEKEKLKERLATLTDGVSVVKIGANTEPERILMKRKVEDAIHAVECAKQEGIVAGGGTALLKCVWMLEQLEASNADEQIGIDIIKETVQSPALRILEVAAIEPEQAPWIYSLTSYGRKAWKERCQKRIVRDVREWATPEFGFDMSNPNGYNFIDLIEKGVIDPVKVVRTAFKNGASCAKTFLSEEVAITPIREMDPVTNPRMR